MATYPIKMLKDEQNIPFVPLTSTEGIQDPNGYTLEQRLATKLGPANLHGGTNISVRTVGDQCYIDLDLPSSLTIINNLTTATAGQGALDAYQGKVLKDMIDNLPTVVDDITSTSSTNALSANQGYLLNNKFNNYVLKSGSTMSGNLIISRGQTDEPKVRVDNGTYQLDLLVGPGGTNRGLYDRYIQQYLIYADADNVVHVSGHLPLTGGTLTGNLTIGNDKGLTITGRGQGVIINGLQTITHWTNDSELTANAGVIFLRPEGHDVQTNQTKVVSDNGGTVASANITLQRLTSATVTYADKQNPRINFVNSDGSQAVSLIFTDRDSYRTPYGLTLVGNGQSAVNGGAYFKTEGDIIPGRYVTKDVNSGSTWINMTHGGGAVLYNPNKNSASSGSNASALWGVKTNAGAWGCGVLSGSDSLFFAYGTDSDYNSGTNTTANAYITSAGAFTSASARKTKENIQPYTDNALDIINDTLICSFNYKADNHKSYRVGFIADDTNSIMSGEEHDSFDINNTVGLLLKAVQELDEKNKKLEERIKQLEEE